MITDGSLAIDTIGFLEHLEKETNRSVIWTCGGTASLIVFLKCLGFNYKQIISHLVKLESLVSLMFGGCLDANASKDILEDLNDWFDNIFSNRKLFDRNITLKQIYKMTKIFPNFITYDDNITCLNPVSQPDYKLTDCVIASMLNMGSIPEYIIDDKRYTSFSKYDPFPISQNFTPKEDSRTLYIANYSIITHSPYTYLEQVENTMKQVYFDRVMYSIRDNLDIALINGFTYNFEIDDYKIQKCLDNGIEHAKMFLNGEDTKSKMQEMIEHIKNQS